MNLFSFQICAVVPQTFQMYCLRDNVLGIRVKLHGYMRNAKRELLRLTKIYILRDVLLMLLCPFKLNYAIFTRVNRLTSQFDVHFSSSPSSFNNLANTILLQRSNHTNTQPLSTVHRNNHQQLPN